MTSINTPGNILPRQDDLTEQAYNDAMQEIGKNYQAAIEEARAEMMYQWATLNRHFIRGGYDVVPNVIEWMKKLEV